MMQKLAHSLLPWWGPTSSADPCFSPDRLQHKLALLQHQCEEKQQLFQSLQSELQIYETLYGNSKKGLKGMFSPSSPPYELLALAKGAGEVFTLGVVEILETYLALSQKKKPQSLRIPIRREGSSHTQSPEVGDMNKIQPRHP